MNKLTLALLASAYSLAAQYNFYQIPDCAFFFSFSDTGSSVSYDNRTQGCTSWTLTYNSYGFSALSLVLQSAPNNSGSPGSWSTWAGAVSSGSNPNTAVTQAVSEFSGYFPFVRVTLNSKTGTGVVTGTVYGHKTRGASLSSLLSWTGSGYESAFICTQSAAISLSASGNTQVVAASGSSTVRVCHISLAMASTVDVKLVSGTGVNCGTGAADVSGVYKSVGSLALDFPSVSGGLRLPAGAALCINLGASVTGGGLVTYAQY